MSRSHVTLIDLYQNVNVYANQTTHKSFCEQRDAHKEGQIANWLYQADSIKNSN